MQQQRPQHQSKVDQRASSPESFSTGSRKDPSSYSTTITFYYAEILFWSSLCDLSPTVHALTTWLCFLRWSPSVWVTSLSDVRKLCVEQILCGNSVIFSWRRERLTHSVVLKGGWNCAVGFFYSFFFLLNHSSAHHVYVHSHAHTHAQVYLWRPGWQTQKPVQMVGFWVCGRKQQETVYWHTGPGAHIYCIYKLMFICHHMVESKCKRKAKSKRDNNDATMKVHSCFWGAAHCAHIWISGVRVSMNQFNLTWPLMCQNTFSRCLMWQK